MNVPSYEFLAFAAVVTAAINLSAAPWWRRATLLLANFSFAASFSGDPSQLAPFAGLLAAGFVAVKLLEADKRKSVFVLLLAVQLATFCWLKRYTFVPAASFVPYAYVTVGMSYVFFRILHLTIDAFQDALPERIGLVSYLNYTLNFTSLVSGPIQFYADYRRTETEAPLPLTGATVAAAWQRIVLGFFKVTIVSPVLLYGHDHSAPLWSIALFAVYLYANFSGYMDVVIGTARFLRLELPENFQRPFTSTGYIEFWGRWHITLSNWFKTYVYSPLLIALMRRYPSRNAEPYLGVFAYFVTFFLVGVWHGQTAMFLVFGLLQGAGVSVNKLYQIALTRKLGRKRYRALCTEPIYAALSRGVSFAYFACSLVWFWASPEELLRLATGLGPTGIVLTVVELVAVASFVLWMLVDVLPNSLPMRSFASFGSSSYAATGWCTAMVVVIVSVTILLNAPAPRIVYRAF